jgi:hypothetical protein
VYAYIGFVKAVKGCICYKTYDDAFFQVLKNIYPSRMARGRREEENDKETHKCTRKLRTDRGESDLRTSFSHQAGDAYIMLRDLLTQKCVNKKRLLILDTPEHVDSENIKIGPRSLLD